MCDCPWCTPVFAELEAERDRLREAIASAASSMNDHKARGLLYDDHALAVLEEALDAAK